MDFQQVFNVKFVNFFFFFNRFVVKATGKLDYVVPAFTSITFIRLIRFKCHHLVRNSFNKHYSQISTGNGYRRRNGLGIASSNSGRGCLHFTLRLFTRERHESISSHSLLSSHGKGCPRGVMVKAMDCGIVVREFLLQSRYNVHFRANTLRKGTNPLILPAMG